MLGSGGADVALVHAPSDVVEGSETRALLAEGRVAVVPRGHPITLRPQVSPAQAPVVAVYDAPDAPDAPDLTTLLAWPPSVPAARLEGLRRAATEVGSRSWVTP